MIKKILVTILCLVLGVAMCACESNTGKVSEPNSLEDFMVQMESQGFDVYDVTHQYDDENLSSVGRAEKAKLGVYAYLYVMDSEAAAVAKAESFIENFEPNSVVQYDEHTITAEMNDTLYLVYTDGPCVYFEYAPEGYDINEMVVLVGAEAITTEEG